MSDNPFSQFIELPDGRRLAYAEYGDPHGQAVFYFHGSPSSRLEPTLFDAVGYDASAAAAKRGLRIIAPDRPGCGLSEFQPGRRILDWPADVSALADQLGIDRFAVMSYSAGGPYGLACAAQLPKRVQVAHSISGFGRSLSEPGAMQGMGGSSFYWKVARIHPWLVGRVVAMQASAPKDKLPPQMASAIAPEDWKFISSPGVYARFLEVSYIETARCGTRGPAYEAALYWKPWEFSPAQIRVPLHLWHGEADLNAPFAHAQRLSETVPGAQLHAFAGEGHMTVILRYFDTILDSIQQTAA